MLANLAIIKVFPSKHIYQFNNKDLQSIISILAFLSLYSTKHWWDETLAKSLYMFIWKGKLWQVLFDVLMH